MAPESDRLSALPTDRDELRRSVASLRDRASAAGARLDDHPLALTAFVALCLQAYAAYRVYAPLGPNEWPVLKDSVIFEYIGWHVARGAHLYTGIYEVKPPLAFELLGVLSLLAGDSVELYHALVLALTAGAVIGSSVVIAALVHELTGDTLGALTGGLTVFILPSFFSRALIGFKSKYLVVVVSLLVVWLALRDRPVLAGVAGAAAVGFWQLAVAFPLIALGLFVQRGDGTRRFVVSGVVTGAVILLPVVLWGAVPAMITETVLTSLLVTEEHSLVDRIQFIVRVLGITVPVVLVGLAALADSLSPERIRREWPLVVLAAWFALLMVFVDFDNVPDVFVWFAVVAVGVGLAVGRGSGGAKRALSVAVLAMVLVSVVTMGGYGTGRGNLASPETYDTTTELEPDFLHNRTERQYLFWNAVEPPTCRVFVGQTQFKAIKRANLSSDDEPYWEADCGQFEPVWDAVVEKYA